MAPEITGILDIIARPALAALGLIPDLRTTKPSDVYAFSMLVIEVLVA